MMMMMHQKAATKAEAEASTWVIWDINSCLIPTACDASRVGPCIKRALKNLGYNGHVTITAVGILTDVSLDVLRSISSTGIVLYHTFSRLGMIYAMRRPNNEHPPPANMLLISALSFSLERANLQKKNYNVLPQVFYNYSPIPTAATSAQVESLWKSFLEDTMDSEEKCSETIECKWICSVCEDDDIDDVINNVAGQGFENFIKHLLSQNHHQEMLDSMGPHKHKSYKEKAKEYRSPLMNAITSVNKEPKASLNI